MCQLRCSQFLSCADYRDDPLKSEKSGKKEKLRLTKSTDIRKRVGDHEQINHDNFAERLSVIDWLDEL